MWILRLHLHWLLRIKIFLVAALLPKTKLHSGSPEYYFTSLIISDLSNWPVIYILQTSSFQYLLWHRIIKYGFELWKDVKMPVLTSLLHSQREDRKFYKPGDNYQLLIKFFHWCYLKWSFKNLFQYCLSAPVQTLSCLPIMATCFSLVWFTSGK